MNDNRNREYYIYGNTAPSYVPKEISVEKKQKQNRVKKQRSISQNSTMGVLSFIMLTSALGIFLYMCVSYLQAHIQLNYSTNTISAMESQLEEMRNDNDALEGRINTYIDLDEVYKEATGRLGMVYADKNQVIRYTKSESEFVRQNEDIPRE